MKYRARETQSQKSESTLTNYLDSYKHHEGIDRSLFGQSAGFTAEEITIKLDEALGAISFPGAMSKTAFSALSYIMAENALLRQEIEQIKQQLFSLMKRIPEERVVVLRDISKEEARKEIHQLFSTNRTLYYSDIARELGLDLEMVVDICNELQESGEITRDARVS